MRLKGRGRIMFFAATTTGNTTAFGPLLCRNKTTFIAENIGNYIAFHDVRSAD